MIDQAQKTTNAGGIFRRRHSLDSLHLVRIREGALGGDDDSEKLHAARSEGTFLSVERDSRFRQSIEDIPRRRKSFSASKRKIAA